MSPDPSEPQSSPAPLCIGVLPIPGFALLSFAALVEPFRAANLLAGRTLYQVRLFSAEPRDGPGDGPRDGPGDGPMPVPSSGPAVVPAVARIGTGPDPDLLFVVAGGDPMRFDDRRVMGWLRQLARRGVTLGGVSGGPVILVRAGVMQGRRMTAHWEHLDSLVATRPVADPAASAGGPAPRQGPPDAPSALAIERRLFVIDRDRLTCAGGTAPLDMVAALLALRHGAAFARKVSDWFIHTEIRPAGNPQRAGLAARLGTGAPAVLAAVRAMEAHLADTLTLGQLARVAGVSERQLNRQFRGALGCSVMAFYRRLRLDIARKLVTDTGLSLTDIAYMTGFSSPSHLASCWRGQFGNRPSDLRHGGGAEDPNSDTGLQS